MEKRDTTLKSNDNITEQQLITTWWTDI